MPNPLKKQTVNECETKEGIIEYDACAKWDDTTLEDAKKSYHAFEYIGSGKRIWVNGVYQGGEDMYWFFKRKSNQQKQ